jgi:hypothetical protein
MTTVLIDADLLIHRCAAAVQRSYVWADDVKSVAADLGRAKEKFAQDLLSIRAACDAGRVVMALSCPYGENWRKLVLSTYKFRRTKVAKPVLFRELRAWVEEQWMAKSIRGLEGDDILGILATDSKPNGAGRPDERIVVSGDKDMQTVPCRLFNPQKPQLGVRTITLESANRYHMMQTLIGDSTDGYTGIPGVGPKGAEKILGAKGGWAEVVLAYISHGLTEADALVQARVAHILRHGEFQKNLEGNNGGVLLWTPERLAA